MDSVSNGGFSFGEFTLDPHHRVLTRGGETVPLKAKTLDLLLALIEDRGNVVTKDALLNRVWEDQFVEENNLTVHIALLRKALGEGKKDHRYIVTVPGKGYRFVAEVAPMNANGSDIVIENHSLSRIVVEEFIEPEQHERRAVPLLKPASSPWKYAALFPVLVIAAAAVVVGFIWQQGEEVPFQRFSVSRLTGNGRAAAAAMSPDGKLYAYTLSGSKGIWVGHTAGGEPLQIRSSDGERYRHFAFSPDSTVLYYVVTGSEFSGGAIFRISVFGGVPEKLRENVSNVVAFAPDMNRIAYIRSDEAADTSTIFISDVAATFERALISRPRRQGFDLTSLAWSKDGETIAVSAVVDEPDAVHREIHAVAVSDGSIAAVTKNKFRSISNIAWAKDGLLFLAAHPAHLDAKVWHASYPKGETTVISADLNNYIAALDLSDLGDSMLMIKVEYIANVWIADNDDIAKAKQVTFSSVGDRAGRVGLCWMSDGRIVYTAVAGTGQALWTMKADGTEQRQLTPTGAMDLNPSVTADAKTIVFSSNRGGAFQIWRVNGDGSDLRQLTSQGSNDLAAVSPDGKWVVYVATSSRDNHGSIWRVPLAGGQPEKLTDNKALWPRVSPDSKFVAYQTEDSKLAVMPISGGEPVKVLDLPRTANLRYGLRWTPDGKTLTYRDWENGYWRQPLTGGPPTRIEDLPEEKLFSGDWSPDGKQLAFTRGQELRDVVIFQSQ